MTFFWGVDAYSLERTRVDILSDLCLLASYPSWLVHLSKFLVWGYTILIWLWQLSLMFAPQMRRKKEFSVDKAWYSCFFCFFFFQFLHHGDICATTTQDSSRHLNESFFCYQAQFCMNYQTLCKLHVPLIFHYCLLSCHFMSLFAAINLTFHLLFLSSQ